MKTLTLSEIRSFGPCYDPNKYLQEDYNGSLKDLLQNKDIPPQDRLWVVVRSTLMSQLQLKHYGLACARLAEKYTTNPVVKLCNDGTEAFLSGKITVEELNALRRDAVAYAADAYAAADAAYAAAYVAADAAYAADASHATAAYVAAYTATAATDAAYVAADADARKEMQEQQCLALINILETII